MFGWLKRKCVPAGPYVFAVSLTIARPANEVYALIDWADPRNSRRQLGNGATAIGGSTDRYRLIMADMPDLHFGIIVAEAVPHSRYMFSTDIVPKVGRLVDLREEYVIRSLGDGQCEVTLTVTATFQDNMTEVDFRDEVQRVHISCSSATKKLKIHAEEGLEAVQAADRRFVA